MKTARLGVDNAKLQAELRKMGGGIIAAPSPCVHACASKPAAAAASQIPQQTPHRAPPFVAPSPKLPQTHSTTAAAAPPPPPPPPPPPAFVLSEHKPAPLPAPALAVKLVSAAPKQSSASLLSQALSEISSKVNSLRHVQPPAQAERRKSSDPSNWIEAALQQASRHKIAPLAQAVFSLSFLQRRALIDSSEVDTSSLSVASDW